MNEVCPWSGYQPGTVSFCEERLCAWVAEPSNSWSSLGYVVVAIMILMLAIAPPTGGGRPPRGRLLALSFAQLMIGVGSFFFHASGTFAGEVVDQIGMFLLSMLILCFSAAQARGWDDARTVGLYAAGVVGSTLVLLVVRPIGIPLFAVQLAVGLGWQVALYRESDAAGRAEHRPFIIGLSIFLVSFAIWLTDITRLLCVPTNHLVTGHAIWHVLNAASGLWLARFYAQRFAKTSPT